MSLPPFLEVDPSDTRQRILSEAVKLFAKMGYARSTTRALAAAAGVTEVTLFRYFESKEKLFEAAVRQFGGPVVASMLEAQLSGDDYRADLMRVGAMFMRILQQRGEFVRLALCEATHFPELRDTLAQNPRALMDVIAGYLEQQIERKRIRPIHPEAAAQVFFGALFSYSLMTEVLIDPAKAKATAEQVVETAVDIFVEGTVLQE
jgi:TetR/AcrR family transcriptional repressor of mexJK operon